MASEHAEELLPIAQRILSSRQYEIWKLTEIEGWTAWRVGRRVGRSVRTVMYELKRARIALATALIEAEHGRIRLGVTIQEGAHGAKFHEDTTLATAAANLGSIVRGNDLAELPQAA